MTEKIKNAFGAVRADEGLKARALAAVVKKARKKRFRPAFVLAPAFCAAAIFFGAFGTYEYFKPVSVISIDIEPSVELLVNRFEKVISVDGENADGERLSKSVSEVLHKNYAEAVEQILESGEVLKYAEENEEINIAVARLDGADSGDMVSRIERRAGGLASCHGADNGEVSAARECGLSYGKYRAFLEARENVPELTPDDVRGLSAREIRERFCENDGEGRDDNDDHHGNNFENSQDHGNNFGNGGGGNGNSNGNNCGNGNGYGNNYGNGNGHHGGRDERC